MKKFYSILAIAAMVAVACSKDDKGGDEPEPQPQPQPVEYEGPEQGTSDWSVIGALSELPENADWGTDWVMKQEGDIFYLKNVKLAAGNEFKVRFQKDWGTNRGGAFAEIGKGFEVVQNGDNVKPGLDGFYDVYYNAAVEQMAVCAKGTIPTWAEIIPPAPAAAVTIDGDFADWAELDPTKVASAICDDNAPWEGVREIRCFAADDKVFYYIRFDSESLEEALTQATPDMHIRLCINTDGEFESGYQSYFLQGYDFIVEGSIAEGGALVDFDGTFFQRIGSWQELLAPGNNLVAGKGNGNEYEIVLDRVVFNRAAALSTEPKPMGDNFQTGIRFYYNGWDEFSNMPNGDIDVDENGWGDLLDVNF